ncbi:RimK family protein [Hyphobacterium sp. CCMP332]|nr:RimK family protein [Hyphobacterium sp. CCMP332]
MHRIVVTEHPEKWNLELDSVQLIKPQDYISNEEYAKQRKVKVINLCKSYQYQSEGYYISLLAEARGHKSIPVTSTLLDFKLPNLAREDAEDFDKLIQEVLEKSSYNEKVEFTVYFGLTEDPSLSRIGILLFNLFQTPLQQVIFIKKEKWQLHSLKPINLKDLDAKSNHFLIKSLESFLSGKNISRKNYKRRKYDLAILVKPGDETPPSDARALQKFVKAAENVGFNADFISKSDYGKITDYDALFIRENTNVNHHTFRFARKAEHEGLAVIDDPNSILKCTNKVYLEELLRANNVATPKSLIFHKNDIKEIESFAFPFVIKLPDGSFSKGVKKVENVEERDALLKEYFQNTDLLIAQEFMPTDFDWRVGVLNGKILFVCKYFMARNHWQIIEWKSATEHREGNGETIAIDQAPKKLISLAIKASKLIGNGLYGVDVKESNGNFYVIEVNDNPNIDSGSEDKVGNMEVYESIMKHLMNIVISRDHGR